MYTVWIEQQYTLFFHFPWRFEVSGVDCILFLCIQILTICNVNGSGVALIIERGFWVKKKLLEGGLLERGGGSKSFYCKRLFIVNHDFDLITLTSFYFEHPIYVLINVPSWTCQASLRTLWMFSICTQSLLGRGFLSFFFCCFCCASIKEQLGADR